MSEQDYCRACEAGEPCRRHPGAGSFTKLFVWIAAETVFQLFVERFGEHGASCEHTCCGVHPIGARSFHGCVDCFTEREQFMIAFYDDRALYIAAIEAALRLPLDAPAL